MMRDMRRGMRMLIVVLLLLALTVTAVHAQEAPEATEEAEVTDLNGVQDFLLDHVTDLTANTEMLFQIAGRYYDLASAAGYDYEALLADNPFEVPGLILAAKEAWIAASPLYEQMEGIVAGVPSLAEYDVILDAGTSAEEDPESAVPFDLTLGDGTVLEQPGNLFGLLEATLWGTRPEFTGGVWIDLDADGEEDFGEVMPEAYMFYAAVEALDSYSDELLEAAEAWEPNETDAFTALVVMVPTMSEYFASWKNSRFVLGDESTQTDFVVISRLSDIQDILSGLIVVYEGVSSRVVEVDAEQDAQIRTALSDLYAYVADLYTQEQEGRVFTPEEADFFGSEAQDRAQAIAGQIAQVAALLGIELPELE